MKIAAWWNEKSFLQKFLVFYFFFSGIMWVLVPMSYAVSLPYDPPETLMWGSTFNWGNAKHPPMSGYMLFYFCKLFGFQHFAVFLLGQLCLLGGFVYVYKLARCFFDKDKSVIATLLITFYMFYTILVPKFNANIPHVLFLPMMYYYFYRGCSANKWHHWLLFAASAACACLSKYSAGVLGLFFAMFMLIDKDARKVLCSVKPYAGALLFFALMTPHIWQLIDTGFLTFNYIKHGNEADHGYWEQIFLQFGAILLPILCMVGVCLCMYILGNWRIPRLKLTVVDSRAMWYSGSIIFIQGLFLMIMGFAGNRLDTEWTFPLYFTAGIFVMSFYRGEVSEKSKRWFAVLSLTFTITLLTGSLIFHNCKTKRGYHIDMARVRTVSEHFYQEQTGKKVPFVTGSLWTASMLQNSFKYTVKAAPAFDPILMGLHLDTLAAQGALVIADKTEAVDQHMKRFTDVKLQWRKYEIKYAARFGKPRTFRFYLAVLPPGQIKVLNSKK